MAQTSASGDAFATARRLTLVAVAPQMLFLIATATDGSMSWIAPVAAFAYAAFIFSFVGGYWWGLALSRAPQRPAILVIAVLPMLLCFALFLPWIWGWTWPGPQLVGLGIAIMAGFWVDWRVLTSALADPRWLRVRLIASFGLGVTTLLIGLMTVANP